MDWRESLLAPLGVLVGRSRVASAERTTQRYLQNVNPASCLVDLNQTLSPLLDGVDHVGLVFAEFATIGSSGKSFWIRSNFAKYVDARVPDNQLITACVPLLWRIFVCSAYYPFSAPINAHDPASGLEDLKLDFEAFKRASALLVMRGFELLGAKQDGRPLSRKRKIETSYADKVPRLYRIIFRCLSFPLPESASQSLATKVNPQLQDLKDTIAFTRPITYDSYPYGPSVGDEHFEIAATRLLRMDDERFAARGSSRMVSKIDLKSLIQLFLLLHPEDRCWRDGLFMHEAYQRSADIYYAHSVSAREETSRMSDFATAFMNSLFKDGGDHVSWDALEAWCSECPLFLFLFFQLWAAIFAPTVADPSYGQEGSSLPISIANHLCLLNVAESKSELRSKSRFHDQELQLQLDLQASTLVGDLVAKPELGENEIHETITARDWYHLLLIHAEDLEAKGPKGGKRSRLIATFLSSPGKEMWREEGRRQVGYVWRSSVVQLHPDLAVVNSGGMSARVVSEGLELRDQGVAAEQSTSIKLNVRQRLVDIEVSGTRPEDPNGSMGTVQRAVENPFQAAERENALGMAEGTSTMTARLIDLKCYRMPRQSVKVTRWP